MISKLLIEQWLKAKEQLDDAKAFEKELRDDICDHYLDKKEFGTHNFIEFGYKIKAVRKANYSFDEEELKGIYDDLTSYEKKCVKYKPSLILKEYNKLLDSEKIDEVISVKDGQATLDIEFEEE